MVRAFMEGFDPATVFSSIDRQGRYAYGQQPAMAQWNLARLAEALLPGSGRPRYRRRGTGGTGGGRVCRAL